MFWKVSRSIIPIYSFDHRLDHPLHALSYILPPKCSIPCLTCRFRVDHVSQNILTRVIVVVPTLCTSLKSKDASLTDLAREEREIKQKSVASTSRPRGWLGHTRLEKHMNQRATDSLVDFGEGVRCWCWT
jgi:hypothetical protein